MSGVTRELAELVCAVDAEDLPPATTQRARLHVLDTIGVALAGRASEPGRIISRVVASFGGSGPARLIGGGPGLSLPMAAWANGAFAHVLDFDDTGFAHPTATVLPAMLAVGERVGSSGRDVLAGLVIGSEVCHGLAATCGPYESLLRSRGYQPSALYTCAGATVAVGTLLRLDVTQMATAIGIALADAGGLSEQFGTWSKGLHAGNAARSGVVAALLAADGYWGTTEILEGRYGFFQQLFGDEPVDVGPLVDGFGAPWAIIEPGVNLKPYPACGRAMRGIEAGLRLHDRLPTHPEDIERVGIDVHPDYRHLLPYRAPTIGFQGKFSLDYCVASALLDGKVGLDSFTDRAAQREPFRRLLDRTTVTAHADWRAERVRETIVVVELKDGTTHTEQVNVARGEAANRMSEVEIERKFAHCAMAAGLDEAAIARALHELARLPELSSLSPVVDALDMTPRDSGVTHVG